MRRIPHQLKGQTKTTIPASFLFFDTETKADPRTSKNGEEHHRLWFGYAKAFRMEGGIETRKSDCYFDTIEGFWKFLFTRLDKKRPLYVFAHNLGFDSTIIDLFHAMDVYNLTCQYYILDDPPNYIQLSKDGCIINLIDTFNYWKVSVEQLGKALGVEKKQMPALDDSFESWKLYCKRDVDIIHKSITNLFEFQRKYDLGSFAVSAPSIAYATFKKCFMKHEIMIHDNEKALLLERNSYYGGLVKNFYVGKVTNKKIHCVDVNSLYPSMMLGLFPSKLLRHYNNISVSELTKLVDKHGAAAEVVIRTKSNVYPMKHNDRLCDVTGDFVTYLCGAELIRALKSKDVAIVRSASLYKLDPIFSDYVNFFWKLRKEFKAKNDYVQEQFCKLLLNSLYGKFGQRGHNWVPITPDNLKILYDTYGVNLPANYAKGNIGINFPQGVTQWFPQELNIPITVRTIGNRSNMKTVFNEHFESMPIVAGYVTSYAREKLRELINIAGETNVYYCDTDSLFVNDLGLDKLKKGGVMNDKELGFLKYEGYQTNSEFYGPKDYVFGPKVVCKGIRKNAKKLEDGSYEQLQFEGLKSVIKRGGDPFITIKKITKKNNRQYKKGCILPNGRVQPFKLTK